MKIWLYFTDEHALEQILSNFPIWMLLCVILIAIVLLTKGADWMIDGAVNLALRTGLPKILIGATILSLGTTAPEAFVSVMAAFTGNSGLALGNGVGSIIADTGLIFGLTVLIAAPPIDRWILQRTGWWQMGSASMIVLLALVALFINPEHPTLMRWMGLILLLLLVLYMFMAYRWAQTKEKPGRGMPLDLQIQDASENVALWLSLVMLLGGLLLVIIASRILIPAASQTAQRFGVPQDVIAATMVALGTSLPELMTAITAIKKGHPEIAIGNVVGADVLNALFVIGAASFAVPLAVPPSFFRFHFPAMILILLMFRIFIAMNSSGRFRRWQGVCLLLVYFAYVIFQYFVI